MKEIFQWIDSKEEYKWFIFIVLVGFLSSAFIEPIILLIFSIPYGGLGNALVGSGLKGQIVAMCGLEWWGGMDFTNYIFEPSSGDCNKITTTYVGSPIIGGMAAILAGLLRKKFLNIQLQFNVRMTLIYFFGTILLCSTFRVLVGYKSGHMFPDGFIYYSILAIVFFRMFKLKES